MESGRFWLGHVLEDSMDQVSFDRIARALGAATSRRAGVKAALGLGAAIGLGAAEGAAAKPRPEGPCGKGGRKDNVCTKDSQCCTGYCEQSIKNKDKQGRCRCIRKGRPCTAKQTCCGKAICSSGVCVSGTPPEPPEICDVCASGCAFTAIQTAVTAATSGATIKIDGGTYREDVTVDKSLTLKACNGAAVTWYNLTDAQRALFVPRADPAYDVVVEGITFTSDTTSGGGIYQENGTLTLSGSTTVTGCKASLGGGVQFGDGQNGGTLVMQDTATVTSNTSDSYGGGVFIDSYTTFEMRGNSAVTNNTAGSDGGGVFTDSSSSMTMRDDASVSGNTTTGNAGGGIAVYGGTGAFLEMHDRSSVTGNTCGGSNPQYHGGGGVVLGTPGALTMDGDTVISGNTSGVGGGGVRSNGQITMSGNAAIKQNTATTGTGGGIYGAPDAVLTKTAPASITGNSPDQCGGAVSC
jgi:hypothetical protein